jgi:hypothetical protein
MTLEVFIPEVFITAREPHLTWAYGWINQPEHLRVGLLMNRLSNERHPAGRHDLVAACRLAFNERYPSHSWQASELSTFLTKMSLITGRHYVRSLEEYERVNGELR